MIQEFEQVALAIDMPEYGLIVGDVGTVVDISSDGQGVTLEFFNFAGKTVAIVPLYMRDIRRLLVNEVVHLHHRKAPVPKARQAHLHAGR